MVKYGRSVIVQDGGLEKAIRKLKKKVQASGVLNELRERETFVKPTTRRKIKKNSAVNRWKKYLASQQLPPRKY
jgi:small subunit ribosomal protein S21